MVVLGIDPGVTTGYAVLESVDEGRHSSVRLIAAGECKTYGDLVRVLLKAQKTVDLIVIEDFFSAGVLNQYKKQTIVTLGFVQGWAAHAKVKIVTQAPRRRTPYLIPAAKLVKETGSRHSRDAAAHALSILTGGKGGNLKKV